MLVLTRKAGEKVVIDGGIIVTVLEVVGNRIRIGIEAPTDVRILRGELADFVAEPSGASRETRPVGRDDAHKTRRSASVGPDLIVMR